MTNAELVVAVEAHAVQNYNEGWDHWVESLSVDDKEVLVNGAKTVKAAIKKIAAIVKESNGIRLAGAESAAVYDGDPEAYARYEFNDALSVMKLAKGGNNFEWTDPDDDQPTSGSKVHQKYKARYGKPQNCGDDLAVTMKEIDPEQLPSIATENGIDFGRWSHLNPGMQRMNLGNVIRGLIKKEEQEVTVQGQRFDNLQ